MPICLASTMASRCHALAEWPVPVADRLAESHRRPAHRTRCGDARECRRQRQPSPIAGYLFGVVQGAHAGVEEFDEPGRGGVVGHGVADA